MKQLAISLLFALIALSLMGQTVQHGVIQEYNEKAKKTTLPGVELTIRSAGSTVSDKKGRFSLNFLTLKPGERVNVRRIEKAGYEIFNKEAVEQWNINPTTPFVIVMCRSDRFKRIRDNYEQVSSESYRRQLQKEEAALARQRQEGKLREEEYQRKLYELRENYERQLDNLENYVDRFSRIDLSELTETERAIIELVQAGRIDEAIARYEQENYIDKYLQQAAQLQEVTSAVEQLTAIQQDKQQACADLLAALDRQIETLKLAGGKENFEKIGSLYSKMEKSGAMPLQAGVAYVRFLYNQSQYEESLALADRLLKNEIADSAALYQIQFLRGNCYYQLGKLDEAIANFEKTLQYITTKDPDTKKVEEDKAILNICFCHIDRKDYDKAVPYFDRLSYVLSPDMDMMNQSLRNISGYVTLLRHLGQYGKADSLLSTAVSAIESETLSANKSEDLEYGYAILCQQKGNIYSSAKRNDEARSYYAKAIGPLTGLYDRNPLKYEKSLAVLNYNIGRSHFLESDSSEMAIPYFVKALDLYESILNRGLRQPILYNYAETLSLLGRIYSNTGNDSACMELCKKAEAFVPGPDADSYRYGKLYSCISSVYSDLKLVDKNRDYLQKSLRCLETGYMISPNQYLEDYAIACCNLGHLEAKAGNHSESAANFDKAISLFEIGVENNTADISYLTHALHMGSAMLFGTAEYRFVVRCMRKLQEIYPEEKKYFEQECLVLWKAEEPDASKEAFRKLLEYFPDYPHSSPLYKAFMHEE